MLPLIPVIQFAIPTNMAAKIIKHLMTHGKVKRGVLGIQVQDLTTDLATAFSLQTTQGALVIDVEKDSAADKAGLQPSDVIIAIDKKRVNNSDELRTHIGLLAVGDKIKLDFMRDGRLRHVIATITTDNNIINGNRITPHLNGTKLSDNNNQIIIIEVERGSSAWKAGLRANDVITHLNRRPINQLKDFVARIQHYSPPYLIKIQRGNNTLSFLFQ